MRRKPQGAKLRKIANFSAMHRLSGSVRRSTWSMNLMLWINGLEKKKKDPGAAPNLSVGSRSWWLGWKVVKRTWSPGVRHIFTLCGLCLCLAPHCKPLLCTTSQLHLWQTCQRHVCGLEICVCNHKTEQKLYMVNASIYWNCDRHHILAPLDAESRQTQQKWQWQRHDVHLCWSR